MAQNSFALNSASISDRGLSEKRPQNEDSYLEMTERGLFVVADGVGGAQAGDVASQMAVEILGEAFINLPEGGDVEELMKVAIERANSAIFQMSHDLPQLSTMATTVVALHIAGNIATIGHAGDSRLYRIDPRGNIFRETQDHSVVEEEVRAGRMTAAQAANHPSKNVISRALGAENTVEVDLKTIMFEPNTTFLLCSDGITRHIEDKELQELLRNSNPPAQICDRLKNICYERGAEDNLTAVIVRAVGTAAENLADIEESTVATARPPLVNSAIFASGAAADSQEVPTQNLRIPAQPDFQAQAPENTSQFSIPASSDSKNLGDKSATHTSRDVLPVSYNAREEKNFATDEKKGSGFFGKLLASLALLLIGAGLGTAGYHFWLKTQTPIVQETPKATPTPSVSSYSVFEENRRRVDINPEQFITANSATAKSAEDFYLLGRAYLLSGKYIDAEKSFAQAKELLPQLSSDSKTMLANEIAIGVSIVNSTFSKSVLEKERGVANQNQPNNVNTNTDTEIKPLSNQTDINMP